MVPLPTLTAVELVEAELQSGQCGEHLYAWSTSTAPQLTHYCTPCARPVCKLCLDGEHARHATMSMQVDNSEAFHFVRMQDHAKTTMDSIAALRREAMTGGMSDEKLDERVSALVAERDSRLKSLADLRVALQVRCL